MEFNIATPGKRLGAFLIDFIVVWLGFIASFLIYELGFIFNIYWLYFFRSPFITWGYWLFILIVTIYLWTKGQTIGKALLRLRAYTTTEKKPAGVISMFLREVLGKFLSTAFLLIGYLWILFDKEKQGWHDKLASTVILDEKRPLNYDFNVN